MSALWLQRLSAGHAGRAVLSNLSLQVKPGEVVALLGANGAGKTTLLRTVAGLTPALGGEAGLGDRALPAGPAARARAGVALSFQEPDDQLFGATVEEDVAIGPRQQGLSAEQVAARVREALAAVEGEALAQRPIEALSYGEKRRVCLAGILAMRARVLLLDEPTSGLDPRAEREAAQLISRTARELGAAVLVATHAIELLPRFADRVVLLGEGRLLLDVPVREAFAQTELLARAHLRAPVAAEVALSLGLRGPLPLTAEELTQALREQPAKPLRPVSEVRP